MYHKTHCVHFELSSHFFMDLCNIRIAVKNVPQLSLSSARRCVHNITMSRHFILHRIFHHIRHLVFNHILTLNAIFILSSGIYLYWNWNWLFNGSICVTLDGASVGMRGIMQNVKLQNDVDNAKMKFSQKIEPWPMFYYFNKSTITATFEYTLRVEMFDPSSMFQLCKLNMVDLRKKNFNTWNSTRK